MPAVIASRAGRQPTVAHLHHPAPPWLTLPRPLGCQQVGDHLLLDVAPQFWTAPEVNACFVDITKGGQVGGWGSSSTLLLILPLPLPLLQRLPALLFTATAT